MEGGMDRMLRWWLSRKGESRGKIGERKTEDCKESGGRAQRNIRWKIEGMWEECRKGEPMRTHKKRYDEKQIEGKIEWSRSKSEEDRRRLKFSDEKKVMNIKTEKRFKVSKKKSYQYGQEVTYHNNEIQLARFCHQNSLYLTRLLISLLEHPQISLALYPILFCSVTFQLAILIVYSYHSLTSGSSRSSRFSHSVAIMLSYLYGMNRKYSHTIRRYFSIRTNTGLHIL